MSGLDLPLLAEKTAAIEQHLARVAECLPKDPGQFRPMTAESDGVILHLWQAVQSVIDLALAACLYLHLGTPPSYGEAFERLAERGYLDEPLAQRLVRAAGFRNVVAHNYSRLDMARVYQAAQEGPTDLRTFLAALRDLMA